MKQIESKRLLQSELRSSMMGLGFSCKDGIFSKRLNDETSLWVGLQIVDRYRPLLAVFPRVGFINWKVAEFFRDSLEFPLGGSSGLALTLHATLAYLVPGPLKTEIIFEPEEAVIRESVKAVTQAVIEYGMPFMTRYPDIWQLLEWAKDPQREPHAMSLQPSLLQAVIYYLAGKRREAKELIMKDIADMPEQYRNHPNFLPTLRLNDILSAN